LPELPEVETVRRGLEQKLDNFIIKKVEVCRDSTVAFPKNKEEFIKGLRHSLIYKWDRRGKYLIADIKKLENKLHPMKREALMFSTSNFSGTYAKEVEAYVLEDKPKKVKNLIKKYCL